MDVFETMRLSTAKVEGYSLVRWLSTNREQCVESWLFCLQDFGATGMYNCVISMSRVRTVGVSF